ncbi:hypothetical protein [Brevibacillus daliensis]|nr:hypothetical protein [Brevibacillus daliensis]
MDMKIFESNDARFIHELMVQAFIEYKDEETVHKPNGSNIKVVSMKKQLL